MTGGHGESDSTAGRIRLRYWASLRAAAGVDSDLVGVAGAVSLAELKAQARDLHTGRRFADVLSTCSVLVDDQPASSHDPVEVKIHPGQCVEFLPPFAGG